MATDRFTRLAAQHHQPSTNHHATCCRPTDAMSAVSDEEKAYILMQHYDGRDVETTTKSSSSATSSVPWYRQAAFVGCAALFAGVVIGRGLSSDSRLESQIGREETMPCFCGGNETNALPANLA